MRVEDAPLGETIPPQDVHAVSVSLPTWKSVVGWASQNPETVQQMRSGYPRFFVHPLITGLANRLNEEFGPPDTKALLWSSAFAAERCRTWVASQVSTGQVGAYSLTPKRHDDKRRDHRWNLAHVVWYKPVHWPLMKAFWQHTGLGISSRRAEYCSESCGDWKVTGASVDSSTNHADLTVEIEAPVTPLEKEACLAKEEVRRGLGSYFDASAGLDPERDIIVYLSGMAAIYDTTRAILQMDDLFGKERPHMASYGFLYVDTIKILSKLGENDTTIYAYGSTSELDELEARLESGTRIRAIYTEFPTNPLLSCLDLRRIRKLADKYNFIVICDDTVGTSVNVDILPHVDIIATSLTKLFSGACNVMGGSLIINPKSKFHSPLRQTLVQLYEDLYFPDDAITISANCKDFAHRVCTINANAQAVVELLQTRQPELIMQIYYPSIEPARSMYDTFRRRRQPCNNDLHKDDSNGNEIEGGYGYLLSFDLVSKAAAVAFFDALPVAKGPSLGTNFTLACPYTLFGHYNELNWAAGYGVREDLVRISVGMERDVVEKVRVALDVAEKIVRDEGRNKAG